MKERITLKAYKETLQTPPEQRTLCFLIQGDEVLLGYKKEGGFGQGKWVGIGGKIEEQDKDLKEAALREAREEIGVELSDLRRVATLDFYFPYVDNPKEWNQRVCVFIANNWSGILSESREIVPKWFKISEVPFDSMWSDATHWLPKVLRGEVLWGEFSFDTDLNVEEMNFIEGSPE
ncbi:MAG: hypothetical protein COX36_01405 [Candidatus Nealsonbacteria bacterium CG23_combo_of_CG06-09_8_20_14_all_38_19]|uniref:Oxidized purine nucleoside triphosphate hydrolase n=1 Tax=Candidatus Nealsonbacteria bacterium CG23_combo_of_CG06-09_8_20_14_all_38_19 TaxID=1974721 RepID=A0A2G9YX07_9BACT|nr:MAG: hypothetical protein COX36_01405 [Candidatus Nealsonbacteria bacterium CG23_combo_of_CG06-09_8_20_14_all_38_19]